MSVFYTCECGTYTFYIAGSPANTQVYPLNFLETSLVDELETNQVFYRRKFQGTLTFGGRGNKTDFDYFWAIEQATPCERLSFLIYRDGDLWWEGYFSTSNGSWDLDACTFEVTPLVTDNYVDLLDKGDIQYNILLAGEIAEATCIYSNGIDADINYTHCRMLIDVIEYLADKIVPGIAVDSTFFEDEPNPVTLTTNRYNYLTIAQKSDIKRPTATNPATTGMLSFNEVMIMLRSMNLYWEYDGSTLIIEHVSYWPEDIGIDIRTQKIARGTNKYKYLNETMPKYEKFSWMEAYNGDFVGYPIWYNSGCVNQDPNSNVVEYVFSNVTTDLQYIIDSVNSVDDEESKISDSGWVILANELRGADLYIWFNYHYIDGTYKANADMSWYWLHQCFWKHDRQLITGYMNNSLTTFYTSKKTKQQECSIVYCDVFDPTEFITTELGETYLGGLKAKVGKAIMKPYGQVDLTLLYGDADNVNTGIEYDKIVFITEVKTDTSWIYGSTFYAVLSEPAPVGDLTVTFDASVYNDTAGSCTFAVSITIPAGQRTANTAEIAWCDPGAGTSYYIVNFVNWVIPVGWTYLYKINSDT